MPLNVERFFRRLWLANGVLVLVLLLGVIGLVGYGVFKSRSITREEGVRPTAKGTPPSVDVRPRAIRYDEAEPVLGSGWMLVHVRYGADYGESPGSPLGLGSAVYERGYRAGGPLVNVLFLPADGGPGRLLLDRPAFIRAIEFPRERRRYPDERIDSVAWITYEIAFEDTDRSGRLDRDDAAELYISDLDGGRLRRVLPAGFRVRSTQVLPDRRLLVTALDARNGQRTPEDQLPQRAFRFNPRTDGLAPDAGLDSLAARAGRILGRP